MRLKQLLILNFRIYILTKADQLTFEQYSVLQDIQKLPYEKEYRKYLAVIMKPLFGAWSIDSFNRIEKNCGRVRLAKCNYLVDFFFTNLSSLDTSTK
jgi:hypothetical protein